MCATLKATVFVYFVRMFNFIVNIVSTKPKHKNENKKFDIDAFDLQEIKRVGQSFYILTFFSLI